MTIKALLFDFDGLILDTETPDVECWRTIYSEYGVDYPVENWSQNIGGWGVSTFEPAEALHKLSPTAPDTPILRARHRQLSDEFIARQPIREGVQDYLDGARRLGMRAVIVSSSERAWVEPHVTRLGLRKYFERIICGDDVPAGRTKPHPDLFLKALADLHLQADEAVVLEDAPHGVKAARAAGIFVVAVPNPITALLSLDEADMKVDSLAHLPLEQLINKAEAAGGGGSSWRAVPGPQPSL
jgi:HAD superfamily hydrolase (TIGR01509 family)